MGRRTIHLGLRVSDRDRSVDFYRSLGYETVGTVAESGIGDLTMRKLPGDEFGTIELVSDPPDGRPTGLSHIVVKVDSLDEAVAALRTQKITDVDTPEPPNDRDEPRTVIITDPDGTQIERVMPTASRLQTGRVKTSALAIDSAPSSSALVGQHLTDTRSSSRSRVARPPP